MNTNKVFKKDILIELKLIESIQETEILIDNINNELELREYENTFGRYFTTSTLSLYQLKELNLKILNKLKVDLQKLYEEMENEKNELE